MRFPRMHIAQSVANRIMNVAAGIRPSESALTIPPQIPDPGLQGAAIDAAVTQPGVEVAPAPGAETAMLQAGLEGGSLLDEAVAAEVIDSA